MQFVVRQQVLEVFEPDARDPGEVEGECWLEELAESERADGELFADRVRDHQKLHDITSYLGWSHDVVWAFAINALRKLGARYQEAKTMHHPMVSNATVWQVF